MNLYCYVTVKKLHYYITDFLIVKVKSQTCSLKENMCVIVIDTYNYIAGFKPTAAPAIATDC